jgi:hypothetical protein
MDPKRYQESMSAKKTISGFLGTVPHEDSNIPESFTYPNQCEDATPDLATPLEKGGGVKIR